jgi:argininosuccinate lyase
MDIKQNKLWGGRFNSSSSSIMERIGESISFDHKLYKQDILGSIAHAKNLKSIGILNETELDAIIKGLNQIQGEIERGELQFSLELEDIHMHIESRLTQLIGEAGKKLHTGRSRNDQVGQDVRLYIRDSIKKIIESLILLQETILKKSEQSFELVMPGYTHLQVAQPIRVSHYLLSYFWAFQRDLETFYSVKNHNDILVLGSGALAGVNYPTDRELIANELNLKNISENSIDAVSQRDHILQYLFASSQLMTHFSRVCEEIIVFTSVEFSFLSLPDELTTGSSIMPQKKNPDIAELIRGKSSKVASYLFHMLGLLKGLPLAYNRDLQEDKISLFSAESEVLISIEGITEMMKGMKFHPENMENSLKKGFSTATDLADYLVSKKKIPFREAHELVGRLVGECTRNGKTLFDIPETIRSTISKFFAEDEYFEAISLKNSTDKKNVYGGTALNRQKEQWHNALKILESNKKTFL